MHFIQIIRTLRGNTKFRLGDLGVHRIDLAALSKRVRWSVLRKWSRVLKEEPEGARCMSGKENSGQGENPLGP